jgi:hypothetical protein
MKKDLILIQSINDFNRLEKVLTPSCDILALNQKVLAILDENNLSYRGFEDFYAIEQYHNDLISFNERVDAFFGALDEVCSSGIDFPYAYSGNALYLLTLLDDLLYLEKLIQIIQDRYAKVYLFAEQEPQEMLHNHLSFSELNSYKVNGTISIPLERSTKRRIQLIYNSIDVFFVSDLPSVPIKIPIVIKVKNFIYKVYGYIDRRIPHKKSRIYTRSLAQERKPVYIIQDGHDVLYLKKYLPKFHYLNRVTKLREEAGCSIPKDRNRISIEGILTKFTDSNFYFLKKYIRSVINSYHIEVVGRIEFFKERFERAIEKDKPALLLFSTGTRDVFDMVSCFVANCCKIPVIFLQHGGHCLFFFNPYQKSLEYNPNILKTLIVQSSEEINVVQNDKTHVLSLGSMCHYETNKKTCIVKPTKEIIYCPGPDTNLIFRQLLSSYSISKKHENSINIMSVASSVDIAIDIKLHPSGEDESFDAFRYIIKSNGYTNVNIIYGVAAEFILSRYKLIIIDFMASALNSHIFTLKVPVILFGLDLKKLKVKEKHLVDLSERCYIAKNKEELRALLERYKNGSLPSKWSEYFIAKYIYPGKDVSPGVQITSYINSIL